VVGLLCFSAHNNKNQLFDLSTVIHFFCNISGDVSFSTLVFFQNSLLIPTVATHVSRSGVTSLNHARAQCIDREPRAKGTKIEAPSAPKMGSGEGESRT